MIPILLLLISLNGKDVVVQQIQFRTLDSCQAAAAILERDLVRYNAMAVCIDRSTERP